MAHQDNEPLDRMSTTYSQCWVLMLILSLITIQLIGYLGLLKNLTFCNTLVTMTTTATFIITIQVVVMAVVTVAITTKVIIVSLITIKLKKVLVLYL